MRRRTFISVLGVIAVTCSALAQNPRQRRVGVLMQGGGAHLAGLEGLRLRLKESGLEVILDVRDGRGNLGVIAAAASDLEREGVEVIVAFSASVAMTTKSATHHVPIVFASGSDPVAFGLVQTINRPGGRLTGVHSVMADVTGKRLELLRQLLPRLDRVVTFYNPKNPVAMSALRTPSL